MNLPMTTSVRVMGRVSMSSIVPERHSSDQRRMATAGIRKRKSHGCHSKKALRSAWPSSKAKDGAAVMREAAERCEDLAQLVSGCMALLESRWLSNNRASDLETNRKRHRELIKAWRARAKQFREFADKIEKGERLPALDEVISNPPSGYVFDPLKEMGLSGLL